MLILEEKVSWNMTHQGIGNVKQITQIIWFLGVRGEYMNETNPSFCNIHKEQFAQALTTFSIVQISWVTMSQEQFCFRISKPVAAWWEEKVVSQIFVGCFLYSPLSTSQDVGSSHHIKEESKNARAEMPNRCSLTSCYTSSKFYRAQSRWPCPPPLLDHYLLLGFCFAEGKLSGKPQTWIVAQGF